MKSLTDPTRLKPIDKKDELLQVIIETPAGSRNKFAYDPDQGIFAFKKVLPAGIVFPYDFGFLPADSLDNAGSEGALRLPSGIHCASN